MHATTPGLRPAEASKQGAAPSGHRATSHRGKATLLPSSREGQYVTVLSRSAHSCHRVLSRWYGAVIYCGPQGLVSSTPEGLTCLGCPGNPGTLFRPVPQPAESMRGSHAARPYADDDVAINADLEVGGECGDAFPGRLPPLG